jgi:hypothetical protein
VQREWLCNLCTVKWKYFHFTKHNLGCVLYSIAVWKEFKYNYFDTERWPETEELPVTDDILFARVIKRYWNGEYASMEALQKDIHSAADE